MGSDIASKNLYALLGNDSDEDPDREVPPSVIPVEKPTARAGKRNAGPEAPVKETASSEATRGAGRGGRGGRRGDFASGNERAFRDRDAGRSNNERKPVEDGVTSERRGGRGDRGERRGYEGRGGRGGGRGRGGPRDDRHSRGVGAGPEDHAKQAAHGWGAEKDAEGELKDEQAGAASAREESKDSYGALPDEPVNADGEHPAVPEAVPVAAEEPVPEPEEDKTKSYVAYLAELAEKKLGLGGLLSARPANEGASKKLPEGKEMTKEETADYFAGSGGKAKRERERKDKNVYVLDHDIQARERERESFRGGRGGERGARGGGRGRGEGGFRAEGRGEGRGRGGRGRGEGRGEYRGARGGRGGASTSSAAVNVTNDADFPSLGK